MYLSVTARLFLDERNCGQPGCRQIRKGRI